MAGFTNDSVDVKAQIEKVVRNHRADISKCYENTESYQQSDHAKLVLSIHVNKSGNVINVEKIEEDFDGKLFSCVMPLIKAWDFGEQEKALVFNKTWGFSKSTELTKLSTQQNVK